MLSGGWEQRAKRRLGRQPLKPACRKGFWVKMLTTGFVVLGLILAPYCLAQSKLPAWPQGFGKPRAVTKASRWPGYKALMGPDSKIWCFTYDALDDGSGVFRITRVDEDGTVEDSQEVVSSKGSIVSFDAAVSGDKVLLFWAEKRGDDFHILIKGIGWSAGSDASLLQLSNTWTLSVVKTVAYDVSLAVSENKVYLGCVDQEQGRPGAFIYEVDADVFDREFVGGIGASAEETLLPELQVLPRTRLSDPEVSANSIRLVPAPCGVWATWVETGQILNRIMLQSYLGPGTGHPVQILRTAARNLQGICMLAGQKGLCHLIYTLGRVQKGEVIRPSLVYALLDDEGGWVVEPQSITQGEGSVTGPSAAFSVDGIAVAWADNRDGKFQIYRAALEIPAALIDAPAFSEEPGKPWDTHEWLSTSGAATLTSKECLQPEIFAFQGGTENILYQVYLPEGDMLVQSVSSRDPVEPGWSYYLGLDQETPFQSGLFRFAAALSSALLFTFLAFPSLAVGIGFTLIADRFNLFSQTALGASLRLLFLFGAVFLMKNPGAWYYLFSPVLPFGLDWLSFGLASTATLCLGTQSLSHPKDVLPTALAGTLFVFFDSLFCVILKGVGLV